MVMMFYIIDYKPEYLNQESLKKTLLKRFNEFFTIIENSFVKNIQDYFYFCRGFNIEPYLF
jgi:hypothetical protein